MLKKLMLGKLIKYEIFATGRIFLPLYGLLIIICVLCRLFDRITAGQIISSIMMIALGVLIFIITIQRFQKNLLGSEGYLMFTLPVTTDSLIWSKMIGSAIWIISSAVMIVISNKILPDSGSISWLNQLVDFTFSGQYAIPAVIKAVITGVLGLFCGILTVYACLALSMLVNKRRTLFAFGIYIAFWILAQILFAVCSKILLHIPSGISSDITPLLTILGFLVVDAVLYGITRYMLRHRLNLE
jgi:hypothetical protein